MTSSLASSPVVEAEVFPLALLLGVAHAHFVGNSSREDVARNSPVLRLAQRHLSPTLEADAAGARAGRPLAPALLAIDWLR